MTSGSTNNNEMLPSKKLGKSKSKKKSLKKEKSQKMSVVQLMLQKKDPMERAAILIQKLYRKKLHERREAIRLGTLKELFKKLAEHRQKTDRDYWRGVNLNKLSREELIDIAQRLELKQTGKKHQILEKIRDWINQPSRIHEGAIHAAAKAAEKKSKVKGSVYYWEAFPGSEPQNIRPLRSRGITKVAANFDSDAVYAIDETSGAAWLCKTGGMSAQIGLCSEVRDVDKFDPPIETRWLVNPIPLHALHSEHIVDIQVARNHAVAISKTGELFVWGNDPHGELGISEKASPQLERVRPRVVTPIEQYVCRAAAVGTQHTVALCDKVHNENGVAFIWGSNSHGQLGIDVPFRRDRLKSVAPLRQLDINNAKKPMKISSVRVPQQIKLSGCHISRIACGALHTAVVTEEGELYTWGCNDGERLGVEAMNTHKPQLVSTFKGKIVLDVACGSWHTAVIVATSPSNRLSGDVYTWGNGTSGQLGQGNVLRSSTPKCVPIPPMSQIVEPICRVSCGMYHTAVQTLKHHVYTWGSKQVFCPLPVKLDPYARVHGRISALSCGRTFTTFCVLPIDKVSYDEDRDVLSRAPKVVVSKLKLPPPHPWPTNFRTPRRLRPRDERMQENKIEMERKERIENMDFENLVHPLCRLCFKCTGYIPNMTHMWMCSICKHNKSMHGPRNGPLSEYEAIRKLQGAYRAKRARRFLKAMVENRYQRVFHIPTNSFYYYNTWNRRPRWDRPPLLDTDFEVPIRDPDELPETHPPWTRDEAATILQRHYRARRARYFLRKLLESQYEKRLDAASGKYYYYNTRTKESKWEKPKLLGNDDDIGAMKKRKFDEKKIKQASDLSDAEAAVIIQHKYRAKRGMRMLRQIIHGRFKKVLDEKTGHHYYLNTVTKEVSWEKPKLLGSEELGEQTPSKKKREFKTEDDAARYIQALFRSRKARKRVRTMLNLRFKPILDTSTGKYYYYDRETKTTSWTKPKMMKSPAKKHRKKEKKKKSKKQKSPKKPKKKRKKEYTEETAARAIQGMFRTHQARRFLHSLLYDVYEKRLDPKTKHYYYHNKRTGHVSWVKPKVLGNDDIPDDVNAWKRKNLKPQKVFTPETAACAIQGMFRTHRARQYLYSLLYDTYEKCLDPNSKHFYYHNKRTGQVSWVKPKILRNQDISSIPKSPKKKRGRSHKITDTNEAATIIQHLFRTRKARNLLLALISQRFEKVFDPNSERYFYYNKQTQESSWEKPTLLKNSDLDDPHIQKASLLMAKAMKRDVVYNEDSAAVAIQGLFRLRKARDVARRTAQSKFEKVWDKELKKFYYFDTVSGESQWEKPKILKSTSMLRVFDTSGNLIREPMSEESAALMIQSAYRGKKAFRRCQSMLLEQMEKHYDDDVDMHFYYNPVTRKSTWKKPTLLGSLDIDTNIPPAPTGSRALTQHDAAVRIQSQYRKFQIRVRLLEMLRGRYQKHLDESTGLYFYFDTKLGTSDWDKPRLLKESDL